MIMTLNTSGTNLKISFEPKTLLEKLKNFSYIKISLVHFLHKCFRKFHQMTFSRISFDSESFCEQTIAPLSTRPTSREHHLWTFRRNHAASLALFSYYYSHRIMHSAFVCRRLL